MGRDDEIKLIAYKIWEEEGCIDGQDCVHWYRAEAIWEASQKEPALSEKKPAEERVKTESPKAAKRGAKIATKAAGKKTKSKKS